MNTDKAKKFIREACFENAEQALEFALATNEQLRSQIQSHNEKLNKEYNAIGDLLEEKCKQTAVNVRATMISCTEFGFRCAEKGMNLEATLEKFHKEILQ